MLCGGEAAEGDRCSKAMLHSGKNEKRAWTIGGTIGTFFGQSDCATTKRKLEAVPTNRKRPRNTAEMQEAFDAFELQTVRCGCRSQTSRCIAALDVLHDEPQFDLECQIYLLEIQGSLGP